MRVLVTGATGFIGSQVARVLLAGGHEVWGLVREGSRERKRREVTSGVREVSGDLTAPADIAGMVDTARPEACIHAAWPMEPGVYARGDENLSMLAGSIELARQLGLSGCSHFVGLGTCFEYAPSTEHLKEESPLIPANLYAASKAALRTVLEPLGQRNGMAVSWLRLFQVYGPGEDPRRLVPSVILALRRGETARLTEGTQIRDFVHVHDVARAVAAVVDTAAAGDFNVAGGDGVSVRDVVERLGAALERPERLDFGAIPSGIPPGRETVTGDIQRMADVVGWRPALTLDEGLRQTVDWWARHADRAGEVEASNTDPRGVS